ncbi:D-2-hydroxyacid dehydrogenase [Armatimonas sp.]|uniref:D-2-hydroxyacid dehydrogenase n=1 Tax=Armatimonas sp. TaxID=1872638 RepID=UPI003752D094
MHVLCLSTSTKLREALTEALGESVILHFSDSKAPDEKALAESELVVTAKLEPELLGLLPKLKVVQITSAGVDGKLYPELFTGGVQVVTGSDVHASACAEHVLAMMLAVARQIPASVLAQEEKHWGISPPLFQLEGKTVGIVGAGQIGQGIATRCKAFGMNTIGLRRNPELPSEGFDVVLPHLQYHELVLRSNMIVLALPLTPSTRWFFGEDEIEIVQRGTYLFNIGRGGLLDEKYVWKALKNKWLAGAGLDVFEDEPLPPNSPWWELDNVLITPHTGGQTDTVAERLAALVAEQVRRMQAGEPLKNTVNPELGY